jgi:hypothetical protein
VVRTGPREKDRLAHLSVLVVAVVFLVSSVVAAVVACCSRTVDSPVRDTGNAELDACAAVELVPYGELEVSHHGVVRRSDW